MDSVDENPGTTVHSKLAYELWCRDPEEPRTITLRLRSSRARVREALDQRVELAEEFGLTYTTWPHPSNRWWRQGAETAIVIHGTCGELVQYLDVLAEVVAEENHPEQRNLAMS